MTHRRVQAVPTLLVLLSIFVFGVGGAALPARAAPLQQEITFTGKELVGLPTDSSVVINIVPAATIELYYQYGTSPGVYTWQTATSTATGGQPHEMRIDGLAPNSKYYFRMQYRVPDGTWVVRDEHSFWTQRTPGSTFVFTVISDSHAQYGTRYQTAMQNVNSDQPDFHFDLGDTFYTDGLTTQSAVNSAYLAQRPYMDLVGHSAPIFLASGNHENEEGWNFDDSPNEALMSINARKLYYPTPITDGFYSGNDDTLAAIDGDHFREDYYAWEWGDALFVVLDPFQYTMNLPYTPIAGEKSDETVSGDQWNWTLGQQQFNWLKQILENSGARFKFVFSHQVVGGQLSVSAGAGGPGYVRGGANAAPYFEWGGQNADGTNGFTTKRPGWGETPIHQMFIDHGVSAYFHGHDHVYAYEKLDGIVYQEVPSPTMTGYGFNLYSESDPYTIKVLPCSGHLRITVTPEEATVDYVRSDITEVSYSYTIEPAVVGTPYNLTIGVDPVGSGTTNPAGGVHSYAEGANVGITATPNSGYQFDHWSGACTGTGSCAVTMDADKTVTAHFVLAPEILGGVNGDGVVDSTDALIVLSCDAGIDTGQYCPLNCGDVNGEELVNFTDALIVLSYDVGMSIPYALGGAGCPASVAPCGGCNP